MEKKVSRRDQNNSSQIVNEAEENISMNGL